METAEIVQLLICKQLLGAVLRWQVMDQTFQAESWGGGKQKKKTVSILE